MCFVKVTPLQSLCSWDYVIGKNEVFLFYVSMRCGVLARARNIGQAYGPLGVVLPAAEAEVDVVSAREMDSGPPSPFYGLIFTGGRTDRTN